MVFDFDLVLLFMRRLARMVARSVPEVLLPFIVPLLIVPLPLVVPLLMVPLFMVPELGVWFIVPEVVEPEVVVLVPVVVWAKAALVPNTKAAARIREEAFMTVEKMMVGDAA